MKKNLKRSKPKNKKIYVYLGGPITGIRYERANTWRQFIKAVVPKWIVVVSPMRHENPLARGRLGIIERLSRDQLLRYQKRITSCCRNDVKKCDIIFINLLEAEKKDKKNKGTERVSIGSVGEIFWADILGKIIIVTMKKNSIHDHIMTREIPDVVTPSLKKGIDLIIKIAKRLRKQKSK